MTDHDHDQAPELARQAEERREQDRRLERMLGHRLIWDNGYAARCGTTKGGEPVWLMPWRPDDGPFARQVIGGPRPALPATNEPADG